MSDLNIVTGDLEALSTDAGNVASNIGGVDLRANVAQAPAAMPGSSSATLISSTLDTIQERCSSAQRGYEDFSADVRTAASNYGVSEANVEAAMRSAGRFAPVTNSAGKVGKHGYHME